MITEEQRQKRNAYMRDYRRRNPEKVAEQRRRCAEYFRDYRPKYYKANKQVLDEKHRRWYQDNRENRLAVIKKWKQENPELRRESGRRCAHVRRARLRSAIIENCSGKIKLLSKNRFCRWCSSKLTKLNRTIDHVIPVSRGGHHIPDNLVAACKKCNLSKSNKLVEEWLPFQDFEYARI